MKEKKKKLPLALRIVRNILIILFVLILAWIGFSLAGRISPGQVIPDTYSLYIQVPSPIRLARNMLNHEPLPDILALPEFTPALPLINLIRSSDLLNRKWAGIAGRGKLEGALLSEGRFLGAWDMGFLSPLLRVLPLLAGRITIPNLYYVQGGKFSRFEFRLENSVLYLGPHKNLLVISNNSGLFESVMAGTSRDNDLRGSRGDKGIRSGDYDIACLFDPAFLYDLIGAGDASITGVLNDMQFSYPLEAALSIKPRQLDLSLGASLSSGSRDLEKIISRNSSAPDLVRLIPDNTQYLTLLNAGSLEEILNAAAAIPGSEIEEPWKKADSSSRTLLRMNLDELLFSWTGSEFAVFGMEGRPSPVLLVEVRDERKRQEVFNRAFKSIFVNENIKLNLDGNRLPRIELPGFLSSLLLGMGIKIPSPYYSVYNGYLFVSESPESLLAAINGARRNTGLLKTDVWKTLGKSGPDKSAFTLFYSLDRSLPFFLKGDTVLTPVLRLYRQGLLRLSLEKNRALLGLSLIPGTGRLLTPVLPFPIEGGGRLGNQVYALGSDKNGEGRILLTQANTALSINPADQSRKSLEFPANSPGLWVMAAEGISGAVWAVNSQGRVFLTDRDLEPIQGFPRITGLRLSAAPASHGNKLYLCDFSGNEGAIHTMDERGSLEKWAGPFDAALYAPPGLINYKNRTYAACYPKEFFGGIWILDERGQALPGWPVMVSGIAFGSPLLFVHKDQLMAAFVTQAGELTVYDEAGRPVPEFPLELEGVFYVQPVYDGEFLWLVSAGGMLFQVNLEGIILSHQIPNLEAKENSFITAKDVDRDGRAEIFVSGEGNALHGYTRNFNALEGFPLPLWGKPAFADLNGNGKMNITGVGMDNRIYLWQFN